MVVIDILRSSCHVGIGCLQTQKDSIPRDIITVSLYIVAVIVLDSHM